MALLLPKVDNGQNSWQNRIRSSNARRIPNLIENTAMAPKPPKPNTKKFGMPLYASAWCDSSSLLVAGGGGKKSSGIPNRVCVAKFDGETLTDPLFSCHTDETAPQALVMCPDRERVLVVFGGDVAVYDLVPNPDVDGNNQLGKDEQSDPPKESDNNATSSPYTITPARASADGAAVRSQLAECDVKCAVFSSCGGKLAVGLEDGRVAICEWEDDDDRVNLKLTQEIGKHDDAVTAVSFSHDDVFIVSSSNESAVSKAGAVVWSVEKKEKVCGLIDPDVASAVTKKSKKKGRGANRVVASYRHVTFIDAYTILCVLNIDGMGFVSKWSYDVVGKTWTHLTSVRSTKDPVSSAASSSDGEAVALGTSEGAVVVVDTVGQKLKVRTSDNSSHMIFVTTMAFSTDSRNILSGSADASARCAIAQKVSPLAALAHIVVAMTLLILGALYLTVFMRRGGLTGLAMDSAERGVMGADSNGGVDVAQGLDLVDAAAQAREELARMAETAARRAAERDADADPDGSTPDPTPTPVEEDERVVEESGEEGVEEEAQSVESPSDESTSRHESQSDEASSSDSREEL